MSGDALIGGCESVSDIDSDPDFDIRLGFGIEIELEAEHEHKVEVEVEASCLASVRAFLFSIRANTDGGLGAGWYRCLPDVHLLSEVC